MTEAFGSAAERERDSAKPQALIVQSDCSVLLEVYSPMAEDARAAIASFAELVKSPEHVLTWRENRESEFPHLELFRARSWGLIVYDEVHLLPAPVFRATADLQARRRLGLTATLVREDGREADVFALIGPSVSTFHGKTWNVRPGSPAPRVSKSECR